MLSYYSAFLSIENNLYLLGTECNFRVLGNQRRSYTKGIILGKTLQCFLLKIFVSYQTIWFTGKKMCDLLSFTNSITKWRLHGKKKLGGNVGFTCTKRHFQEKKFKLIWELNGKLIGCFMLRQSWNTTSIVGKVLRSMLQFLQ